MTTLFPGGFGEARAVALQPDGKIVVAGAATGAGESDFLIARYNSDGSPDGGFGGGDGIQILPVGEKEDGAEAVAIGSGGKIYVTGTSRIDATKRTLGVAVLKPEGEPDAAFAGDGTTTVKATANDSDQGVAIAELPGGRILIGDAIGNGAGDGFALVQLDSAGLPDPGFGGGDGIVETPISGPANAEGRVSDFVRRPDGRIVAAGYGFEDVGTPPMAQAKFAAVGYLENGDLDASFGDAGIFTRKLSPGSDSARTIVMTPTGRFVLGGTYDPEPGNASPALLRLDSNGALDAGFGSGGQVLGGVRTPFGESFEDAALDAEERLVMVSRAYTGGGETEIVVSRFLGDKVPALLPIAAPGIVNQPPHARMKAVKKKVPAERLKGFSGIASDADGDGVKRVQIAVVKRMLKGRGVRCFALKNAKARFKRVQPKGKQCPQRWLTVKGKAKWGFRLKRELPPGRYVVFARAVDGQGLAEAKFSRKLRNRYGFRVLPSR